jgi:hypothetical protein
MRALHAAVAVIGVGLSVAVAACSGDIHHAGGSVQVTTSGEVLALGGYPFPPRGAGDPAFVDGWEVRLEEVLVTLDHFTLSENPDKSPTDQSQTDRPVARADGPWAVDLHHAGPLLGKGGTGDRAWPLATLRNQNLNGGADFVETERYAFGFDVVVAAPEATPVNLGVAARRDYAEMVKNGWTVLYVGTATWQGGDCTSNDPGYDFGKLPNVVAFRLAFASPTTYSNCQNPDNDPATALGSEEHQRGVQIKASALTIVQATVHTDHPFRQSVHDAPLHFDQLAARARNLAGVWTVTLEDLKGADFTAFQDGAGQALPWRSCLPSFAPPDQAPAMHFDAVGIPYDPLGKPTEVLRDYRDFITYSQSTQGHLNSDGLCFVERHYPSPP